MAANLTAATLATIIAARNSRNENRGTVGAENRGGFNSANRGGIGSETHTSIPGSQNRGFVQNEKSWRRECRYEQQPFGL